MRRKFLGLAIAAFATLGATQAWAGDREIAEQIIERLQSNRDSGALKDFTLDMKVDQGNVLFRGSVNDATQKRLVLKAAEGITGVSNVTDEVSVKVAKAVDIKPPAVTAPAASDNSAAKATRPKINRDFSLRDALAEEVQQIMTEDMSDSAVTPIAVAPTIKPLVAPPPVMPGEVRPTAGVELSQPTKSADQRIVSEVVKSLSKAQKSGALKGFGVDVKSNDGVVWLKGRAASSAQRTRILQIAESTPGVQRIRNSIRIPSTTKPATSTRLPEPPALAQVAQPASTRLLPAPVQTVAAPVQAQPIQAQPVHAQPVQAQPVHAQLAPVQAQPAPYRAQQPYGQPLRTQPVQATIGAPIISGQIVGSQIGAPIGAPVMGTPVPMGGHGGAIGAPRYDSPNLPNYAWPGYSAYPNYAALSYPQQYSPSAWPYIGPFYPYPQVPLGWRKVSLEWDDGWWQLDFTDR